MREMGFIFIIVLYEKKNKMKRLIDSTGHNLLDIYIMHLFTPNFTLLSMFFATKTEIIFMNTSM